MGRRPGRPLRFVIFLNTFHRGVGVLRIMRYSLSLCQYRKVTERPVDRVRMIQRSEGNGQSTNVTGRYRPSTFHPVSNPGQHPASGTPIKVTPVKSSTLDVSPL